MRDKTIRNMNYETVRQYYKPYTAFVEADLNLLCAHGRHLSVYDRDKREWSELMHTSQQNHLSYDQLTVKQKNDARLDAVLVTEEREKKQFHVLRRDGLLLEAANKENEQIPESFPDALEYMATKEILKDLLQNRGRSMVLLPFAELGFGLGFLRKL